MVELHCEPAGLPKETWRPKVYFAGHPRAARKFFPLLQEAICRIRPCDIFYLKDPEAAIPPEEEDRVLGNYHLFVVPVITDMLANSCRTTEVEIPYARKHHIPILPILMEPGLVPLFRLPRHFEDLSFIEYETTPDHIFSFEEQLATFLNGVLISEAEAALVQARRYHDYRDRLYYRAVSYLAGITTEANPEAALERLIKLSPHHPKALYLLYRIYYRGIGVPADPRKALACINRLSVYWHRQEEIKNWPEALQYLRDMVDNDILTVAPEGAYLLAERLYKRASRTLGELHPITLGYSKSLAHCCIRQTKYDRLLELLRRLLHFSTIQLGRDHPDTQAIVLQLAHFYHKAQEPADALELYREALDYNRQHYGPQALPTLQTEQTRKQKHLRLSRGVSRRARHKQPHHLSIV